MTEMMPMERKPQIGDRIRFLREISEQASEESPGCLFARAGDGGTVTGIGHRERRYWVVWDRWPTPFACASTEFEIETESEETTNEQTR